MEIDRLQKLIRLEIQRDKRIDKLRSNIADLKGKLHMHERAIEFKKRHPDNIYNEVNILPEELLTMIPDWIERYQAELNGLESV